MKHVSINGVEIAGEAVQFELERIVRFYVQHGISEEEIKRNLPTLEEKALEQAIGAKLLLDRSQELDMPVSAAEVDAEVARVVTQIGGEENFKKALADQGLTEVAFRKELEKGVKVNKLVEQACSGVPDPTDDEVAAFYTAHKSDYATLTLVDVHDQIKDLLRHEARGRAMDAYVAELKANAKIEYRECCGRHLHGDGCGCTCGHHHE